MKAQCTWGGMTPGSQVWLDKSTDCDTVAVCCLAAAERAASKGREEEERDRAREIDIERPRDRQRERETKRQTASERDEFKDVTPSSLVGCRDLSTGVFSASESPCPSL